MHFALRIKDSGKAGVVFKYVDAFNFYFLEFDKKGIEAGRFIEG